MIARECDGDHDVLHGEFDAKYRLPERTWYMGVVRAEAANSQGCQYEGDETHDCLAEVIR